MSINHIGKHISRSLNGKSRVQTVKNILFNYSHNDWRQHVDPNIERNVYNETKVYEDDFVSLHISTWKPGYISTINKYTKGECWTKVLKGELIERQYDNNSFFLSKFSVFTPLDVFYINNSYAFHSLENRNITFASALHVHPK